jgi:choline dehydrogenase
MSHLENTFDFIIVGAGTAGSVLAARLSEDRSANVLVLEAGAAAPLPASAIPPAWPTLMQTESNWGDMTSVQSATGLTMPFARGRGIGGSSSINAMVFARGHRDSYARWSRNGAVGWSYDDLLPYFKRTETATHRDPRLRGSDGPMLVAPACPPNPVLVACLDAAVEAGFRRATDISGGEEIGFGFTDLNIVDGRRQSAADAYLAPALARPNLVFEAHALVQRLLIEKGKCVGVEYSHAGGSAVAFAAGEVVLAAGAIGSPHLLMVSGVGPHAHLREVGIEVVADLPGVGANLQDHPICPVVYRATKPVPEGRNNHGELLGLICTARADSRAPDLQIFGVDSAMVPGLSGAPHGFVLGVSVLQPFSRGTVRLAGPTASTPPIIDPNYFGDDHDVLTMVEGLRVARRIGGSTALDNWRAEEMAPGHTVADDNGLRDFALKYSASYFHPVGTCAIGDHRDSVVDTELRVHGVTGLRVVDGAVMPSIPSNNTVATVFAIAERGADLLRGSQVTGGDEPPHRHP